MNRKITQKLINDVIKSYNDDLLGSDSIAKKLNMGKQTVLKILHKNNVVLRGSGQQYRGGKKASDKRYYEKPGTKERKKEISKKWADENRNHLREYHTKWREKNQTHVREYRNNYERTRKSTDPIYKLIAYFRTAMYTTLKENNVEKNGHYFDVLGYSPDVLKKHLEKQFTNDMCWDNYGDWHVDHKIPISSFNFTTMYDEEFKKCWELDNLQPLWGPENIKKSNHIL